MDAIFERFIRNMDRVKETWQIVEFFENEFKKFKDEIANYESDIAKEQSVLKKLREEYLQLQQDIKLAKDKIGKTNTNCDMDSDTSNTLIRALEKVDIRLKDGIIVKANPAYDVYSKEIVEKYMANLREMKSLKAKLLEVEFENTKLKNELREVKS